MKHLHLCCFAILGVVIPAAALAQATPVPGGPRLPPSAATAKAVRCIPGFTLAQSGRTYTCTSAPVRCDRPYQSSGDAGLKGDRFVYSCTQLQ